MSKHSELVGQKQIREGKEELSKSLATPVLSPGANNKETRLTRALLLPRCQGIINKKKHKNKYFTCIKSVISSTRELG